MSWKEQQRARDMAMAQSQAAAQPILKDGDSIQKIVCLFGTFYTLKRDNSADLIGPGIVMCSVKVAWTEEGKKVGDFSAFGPFGVMTVTEPAWWKTREGQAEKPKEESRIIHG